MNISFTQSSLDLRERFFSLLDSLSALRALAQINLEEVDEDQLIDRALNELVRYQSLDQCSVFRLDGDLLCCTAGLGMVDSQARFGGAARDRVLPQAMSFKPGEGIVGIAYASGQLQYCRDCSQSQDFVVPPLSGGDIPGSLVCAPIKMGNQVLGVLNASHPMPEFFEPWQQHTLSLFSSCLGQILYNHRMLHDLEQMIDQRTQELEQALCEANELRKRYEQLSVIDELTGLNNRRYFFREAPGMVARALRYRKRCSLVLIDVDHFKRVNDHWGHQKGDQVLIALAQLLKEELRGGDMLARMGGEEFVIMLPETGIDGADLMAQRIQERLQKLAGTLDLSGTEITVSIGMTTLAGDTDPATPVTALVDTLYGQADQAMYDAKGQGRNQRIVYQN
ncbi:MAG: sensor domain-containing diguanylate cyclase [Candidatus Thiodiazotropha sp.]